MRTWVFTPSAAGGVLVWANVGGLAGSLLTSFAVTRISVRLLTVALLIAGSALVTVFGSSNAGFAHLSVAAAFASLCTNGAMVGLYALVAQAFPATLRGSGTGIVIGIGRGGAALSPILAGQLFANGWSLAQVAATLSIGSIVSAAILMVVGSRMPRSRTVVNVGG